MGTTLLTTSRVMAIVAHYDDEVLFCGGTLLRLQQAGCQLHIVVATHVNDTNHGSNDEPRRQCLRLQSFERVAAELDATAHHLGLPNYRGFPGTIRNVLPSALSGIADALATLRPDAVLTHDYDGEYGNWMHRLVHYAVRDVWQGPGWLFSLRGQATVEVNADEKRRLLEYYRDSVVLGERWEPWNQPAFRPYCGHQETFRSLR
jgi:LmbE family N-acetylglucosaminyl deacetylase